MTNVEDNAAASSKTSLAPVSSISEPSLDLVYPVLLFSSSPSTLLIQSVNSTRSSWHNRHTPELGPQNRTASAAVRRARMKSWPTMIDDQPPTAVCCSSKSIPRHTQRPPESSPSVLCTISAQRPTHNRNSSPPIPSPPAQTAVRPPSSASDFAIQRQP